VVCKEQDKGDVVTDKPKANGESTMIPRRRLSSLAGQHFGGDRDLYATMGYPRHLTAEDYVDAYLRQDIAASIVDAYPDATWREPPEIAGNDDLAREWATLDSRLQLWRGLHRADRLTGIGHYGVILLGMDGGQPMDQPVRGSNFQLLYVQPHSERTAQVTAWEDDPTSPRYGKPKFYRVTTGVNWTGSGAGQKSLTVHHSRVIHIAERALEDESIGTPRLERIWNRLMDLDKLLGSSAEIYWQNSAMIMQLKADLEVEWSPEEADALATQVDEMQNGLRRWLRTRGVDASNIAPGLQGSDASNTIERLLDVVAGAVRIPKRILVGSEAGELASSQDENNWAGRIQERREQFAGPSVAEPFIRRLQALGVLPGGAFTLEWPESDNLGEDARADIALKKAQAIATYANSPGAELLVTPDEFRYYLGEDAAMPEFVEDGPLDEGEAVVQFYAGRGRG
jgi:hypothetical protein